MQLRLHLGRILVCPFGGSSSYHALTAGGSANFIASPPSPPWRGRVIGGQNDEASCTAAAM